MTQNRTHFQRCSSASVSYIRIKAADQDRNEIHKSGGCGIKRMLLNESQQLAKAPSGVGSVCMLKIKHLQSTLYRNNNKMGVENKTSCWESETMNRHSAGPGGSEESDELSSSLFVLRRLMWIQMDRSWEGTECASIFTCVCLFLPDKDTRGDTNSWMACRFFTKVFTKHKSAFGTTVPAVITVVRITSLCLRGHWWWIKQAAWIKIWSFQLQTHTKTWKTMLEGLLHTI